MSEQVDPNPQKVKLHKAVSTQLLRRMLIFGMIIVATVLVLVVLAALALNAI